MAFEKHQLVQLVKNGAKIKVVGVGGSGCNAVNTMMKMGLEGVDFITANTDRQALDASLAPTKLAMGQALTKGLGAGANPDIGRKAALEDSLKIAELLSGADLVFVTAGMGGGTGTGAASVFSRIARELGALSVGVVTKPFLFEGRKRMKFAEQGIARLRENVDSLIMIPNQRLLTLCGDSLSMLEAFQKADEVLLSAVRGIADLINHTGLINSDFADVRTIMQNKGLALIGIGYGEGEQRMLDAATGAISSPLLRDISIDGATGVIINITGGSSLKLHEVNEATTFIMESMHEEAEIIFGAVIDESLQEKVKITVIATGLEGELEYQNKLKREMNSEFSHSIANSASFLKKEEELPSLPSLGPSLAEPISSPKNRDDRKNIEDTEVVWARELMQKLELSSSGSDALDVPTYLRRRKDV